MTGLRVMQSIERHELRITRAIFTQDNPPTRTFPRSESSRSCRRTRQTSMARRKPVTPAGCVEPVVVTPEPRHIAAQQILASAPQSRRVPLTGWQETWGPLPRTVGERQPLRATPEVGVLHEYVATFPRHRQLLALGAAAGTGPLTPTPLPPHCTPTPPNHPGCSRR
ncbi:hypothetical protein ACWEK5_50025 [Rhodococcus koreensis]